MWSVITLCSFGAQQHLREEFPLFSPLTKQYHTRSYEASLGLPAQHVRLEAKQSSDRSPGPQASDPQVWVVFLGACRRVSQSFSS